MKIKTSTKELAKQDLRQRAFTLVEMLLVLTILAILAGIVLPKMTGSTEQARITRRADPDCHLQHRAGRV